MLPRLAAWLLGESWRTSLAAASAAILYGAKSVPAILDGTATEVDWRRAAFSAALYLVGRFSADNGGQKDKSKEEQPNERQL